MLTIVLACSPDAPVGVSPRDLGAARDVNSLSTTTVVVTPAAPNGWAFLDDNLPPPAPCAAPDCQFVSGPGVPPSGIGSAQITVASAAGRNMIGMAMSGLPFSSITRLEYSTYRQSADPGNLLALALQFNVDYDLSDANTAWQSRIVFEPYHGLPAASIPQATWQTWDVINGGSATGQWWGPQSALCPQSNPCTWTELLANYPNIGVHATFGALLIKAGGGWTTFTGNVDRVVLGVSGADVVYDFEPALGSCSVDVDGGTQTLTLLADCVTSQTLRVPDGWTLDGDGYTITAIDPTGGHFRGAVVRNDGASAHVVNLSITASGLANVCDPGDDRLRGILFDGAAGTISNNVVTGIRQGVSGCQEGNGIEVRNAPFDDTGSDLVVTIAGNVVSGYQKNGITANGSVAAFITDNQVTGDGPVAHIAQNGIQIGFGATAEVRDNAATGNDYTPASDVACGFLLFQAGGVKSSKNVFSGNERDQCNFGKGGGQYLPTP
jgi:hypothetical protein